MKKERKRLRAVGVAGSAVFNIQTVRVQPSVIEKMSLALSFAVPLDKLLINNVFVPASTGAWIDVVWSES